MTGKAAAADAGAASAMPARSAAQHVGHHPVDPAVDKVAAVRRSRDRCGVEREKEKGTPGSVMTHVVPAPGETPMSPQ